MRIALINEGDVFNEAKDVYKGRRGSGGLSHEY
jgi:hypothetical protein